MIKSNVADFSKLVIELNSNIELTSDYINNITPCMFKCSICNKEFKRTPKRFKTNPTCRYCSLKEKGKNHSAKMQNHKATNIVTLEKFKNKVKPFEDEYIIDYSSYIDRNHKILVTHKKCNRSFEVIVKNFYANPKCLCCAEDERRLKISKSLKDSTKSKKYHNNRNLLCKDNFKDVVYNLVKDEYTFLDDYIDNHSLIRVKHNKCEHIYEVSPNHFISKGTRCPFCFRQSSNLELEVYEFIKENSSFTIIRNDRKILYPYELDIYIPEKNLAIEINGTLWHSGKYKDKNYHYNKSKMCEEKGIRLIHIWEYEWNNERQRPILENIIKNALGVNENKIYARKCKIIEKPSKEMKDFFNKNNIQGFRPGKFSICLEYRGEIVMAYQMGACFFGKGKYQWEVIRGATKLGYTIIGGASKIWSYFIKTYNPKNCVYYIDYNYFNGNSLPYLNLIYLKTQPGFKNYFIKTGEIKNRNPLHHKEIKELINKGLVIPIWNAGTKVYIWNKEEA